MPVPPFLNNLAGLNAVVSGKGGALMYLNEINALNGIDVIETGVGGYLNGLSALNSIDVLLGGSGGYLNELDALNSIVVLEGGIGGHLNTIGAINEWVDNSSGFTGILDSVTGAIAAYSWARRLSTTTWGTVDSVLDPLVRLIRDSDSAELTFSYGADNLLDIAAVVTWLAGANADIVKLYDQTGNGFHRSQSTVSQQPLYVASGIGSIPTAEFSRSASQFLEGTITAQSSEFTLYVVFRPLVNFSGSRTLVGSQAVTRRFFMLLDADTIRIEPSTVITNFDISALSINTNYVGVLNRDASDNLLFFESGVDTTVGTPTNSEDVAFGDIGASTQGGNEFDGQISEIIYYQADHSTAQREEVEDNQGAAYGITIS